VNDSEFPERNLIIFLTFSVIFVTLVLQGLTLAPLIRMLGLAAGHGSDAMSNRELQRYRTILGELLPLERKTAVRLRNEGRINDEVLRKIEHELDLSESRLALS
jgi:NhaP-type Na+/H+ or K+/H+ antiporter